MPLWAWIIPLLASIALIMGLVLLMLSFLVSLLTLGTGRTNMLQGTVHLVIFAAFLFLSLFP